MYHGIIQIGKGDSSVKFHGIIRNGNLKQFGRDKGFGQSEKIQKQSQWEWQFLIATCCMKPWVLMKTFKY